MNSSAQPRRACLVHCWKQIPSDNYNTPMAAFDAAMALDERQLDQAFRMIYMEASYQDVKIFTGSKNFDQSGIASVLWRIDDPPRFDLSRDAMQSAAAALANDLWEQHGAEAENITRDDIHGLVSAGVPTFTMRLGVWVEVKDERGRLRDSYYLPGAEANCFLQVTRNSVEFVVRNVTCGQTGQFYVESYVLPAVKQALQSVLSGFTIPPFLANGINFTAPSISMDRGCILVAVNIEGKSIPAPVQRGSWVSPNCSLAMSQDFLQKAIAVQYSSLSDEKSGGSAIANFHWSYSMSLVPQVALTGGPEISASLSLTGKLTTNVNLMSIPVPVDCKIQIQPSLATHYMLEQDYEEYDRLRLSQPSISPFDVTVTPRSALPLDPIAVMLAVSLAKSLEQRIWESLRRSTIPLIDVPTFLFNIAGWKLTLELTNLQIVSKDGYIVVTGQLSPKG